MEHYTIDNKDLPILMQKIPYLPHIAMDKGIDALIKANNTKNFWYFVLYNLVKSSQNFTGETNFLNLETYFKKLSNFLIYMDISYYKSFITSNRKKPFKKGLYQFEPLKDILDENKLEINIWDILRITSYNDVNYEFDEILWMEQAKNHYNHLLKLEKSN
jgi:hypothetical protein